MYIYTRKNRGDRLLRLLKLGILLLLVILSVELYLLRADGRGTNEQRRTTRVNIFQQQQKNSHNIAQVVQNSLQGTSGTYAVVIKRLPTGEEFMQDENRVFEAASLYKLWIMATVYQQLGEGRIKKNNRHETNC